MTEGATVFGLPEHLVLATAGVWGVLIAATLLVLVLRWRRPEHYGELVDRTTSWWWMIGAFTLAIVVSQTAAIVFLAFISYLALKEYLSLIPTRRIDRGLLLFAYLAIPIQYYWAADDWYGDVHRLRAGLAVPVLSGAHGAARRHATVSCARSARCPGG